MKWFIIKRYYTPSILSHNQTPCNRLHSVDYIFIKCVLVYYLYFQIYVVVVVFCLTKRDHFTGFDIKMCVYYFSLDLKKNRNSLSDNLYQAVLDLSLSITLTVFFSTIAIYSIGWFEISKMKVIIIVVDIEPVLVWKIYRKEDKKKFRQKYSKISLKINRLFGTIR